MSDGREEDPMLEFASGPREGSGKERLDRASSALPRLVCDGWVDDDEWTRHDGTSWKRRRLKAMKALAGGCHLGVASENVVVVVVVVGVGRMRQGEEAG